MSPRRSASHPFVGNSAMDPLFRDFDWAGTADSAERILVVDDNADMRRYLRRILLKRWKVDTAIDGMVALGRCITRGRMAFARLASGWGSPSSTASSSCMAGASSRRCRRRRRASSVHPVMPSLSPPARARVRLLSPLVAA